MLQPGSDSLRSSSPSDSVVITPPPDSQEAAPPPLPDKEPPHRPWDDACSGLAESEGYSQTPVGNDVAHDGVWASLDSIAILRLSLDQGFRPEAPPAEDNNQNCFEEALPKPPLPKSRTPFHKWAKTLHRRRVKRRELVGDGRGSREDHRSAVASPYALAGDHSRSSSGSSLEFVTGTRSASVSLASASIIGRSRRTTLRSSRGCSKADRNSRTSISVARLSEDSPFLDRPLLNDPVVTERALQRRRILEELISTEEGYIGDVRFLTNVYVTILASLPTSQSGLRSSINRNLTDIIELHEDILGELHRAVPDAEYAQLDFPKSPPMTTAPRHHRWRSLDAVPENNSGISWLQQLPGMISEPQVAAEVAKVFAKKMNRFFVYEEYGAKYELMLKDIAVVHRTMPDWDKYQKGLEALAASLGSANSHGGQAKKALTINDLLVKPIQRVCRYPLLFAELLKHTPVCDCPYSYMEIESALIRLREATGAINRATDDEQAKATLEKTWLLQDRLVFPDQRIDVTSRSRIRAFGHIQLCGVLHICWQIKEGVAGSYMVCLLYREWLCLATASKADQVYTIQASLALANINVEEVDNGKGLQCHTAPFSWKLVFECDHQLYEIIVTACNPKEEMEWRSRLSRRNVDEHQVQADPPLFSSLSLNIKTLGVMFSKPGTVARRISIHRATTVGPKSPLYQVILKNTSVEREVTTTASKSSINRSQSLLTTNSRIPVLAPSRGDRARLEALLSDVWTREVLPFPGITVRARSEHLVRSSASSVMRKLSVASIASSFTKRSGSFASINKTSSSDEPTTNTSSEVPRTKWAAKQECHAPEAALNVDELLNSRLPVISDETGRSSPAPPRSHPSEVADVVGTIRRVEALKLEKEWPRLADGKGDRLCLLRAASLDGLRSRARRTSKSHKKSAVGSARDVTPAQLPQGPCKASSIKSVSKWTKVPILQRGVMVDSIRSFFR